MRHHPRFAATALACAFALGTFTANGAAAVDYARDVKPLIATACVQCHSSEKPKGGLRLDTAANAMAGGDSGNSIVPGAPEKSLFIQLLDGAHDDIPQMPYKRNPLTGEQTALLKQWIREGAKAPANEHPSTWSHWAFSPPAKRHLPMPSPAKAPTAHPVDAWINAALEKEAITPSNQATAETLIRRVSLDLTGLPPTLEEVAAFTSDKSPDAYEKLVDRLLASPHFGERWGRWWLDQARYSDSNGYSIDAPRNMWPYRDWVVQALNADMPFNQFTIEQLAGDLLPNPTLEQRIATGFHRNTQINGEGGIDPEQFRVEAVFDRVATTGSVWLGLTVGCCQCHDHKFDPLSQREYFGFYAFFNNQEQDGHGGTKNPTVVIPNRGTDPKQIELERKELLAKLTQIMPTRIEFLTQWEAGLLEPAKKKLKPEELKALQVPAAKRTLAQQRILYAQFAFNDSEFKGINDRLIELESEEASRATSLVMQELSQPRKTQLFIKGDFTRPAEEVAPGTPSVLPKLQPTETAPNRLDLARWLVSRDQPLTARVIVNRIWQHYFGKGLVVTENDFGTQGILPTHPELLDWLAVELMDQQWRLKAMHRLIVTSDTYKRSSDARPDLHLKDPYNRLLAHQTRLRLDAEFVRDVCLTASGLLSRTLGGQPVYPPQPEGAMSVGQTRRPWPVSKIPDRYRRGLYTFLFRASPHPAFTVFDAPDSFTTCTRRNRSNTPLQALTLLNDAAFFEFAEALKQIIERDGLESAFQRCVSRRPSPEETRVLAGLTPLQAARTLLNLDETITRE
jgi:mono/diheme cytochrome c family protein